ncbi:MAG: hypothetical protein OXC68_15025, partial [Aestuariivita sp.]|nr:hypothetical protein [Aestuariivita sp.]
MGQGSHGIPISGSGAKPVRPACPGCAETASDHDPFESKADPASLPSPRAWMEARNKPEVSVRTGAEDRTKLIAGIDVSKHNLNVHVNGQDLEFGNTRTSIRSLAKHRTREGVERVVLEATGRLHR